MTGLGRPAVQLGSLELPKLGRIEQRLLDARLVFLSVLFLIGIERLPN